MSYVSSQNVFPVTLVDSESFSQNADHFIVQGRVMGANEFNIQSNASRVGNTLKSRVGGQRVLYG